ncbi:MAG TPA: hypothetical protein VGV57_08745 [Thermoleophilaceae bacterium]|nr:hypothetical protein [Thermoleophilaceae bacterium]
MTECAPEPDELGRLLGPGRSELLCESCFEALDRYVELDLGDADADAEIPGMREHLEGCPACREDYESLRAFVASEGRMAWWAGGGEPLRQVAPSPRHR